MKRASRAGTSCQSDLLIHLKDLKTESGMQDSVQRGNMVLVVDDQECLRMLLSVFLQRDGFQPLVAADGEEGVSLFRANADAIACVVVDKSMPGLDGIDMARMVRAIKPAVPVIVASGFAAVDVGDLADDPGPTLFIQKPFSPPDLVRMVREVLGDL